MNAACLITTAAIALANASLLRSCAGTNRAGNGSPSATAADSVGTAGIPPRRSTASTGDAEVAAFSAAPARPATGKTSKVQMIGDAKGYRYEPSNITIHAGDAVQFSNVSGLPHSVTFWPDSVPQGTQAQLQANMPITLSPLTGPLLTNPNQTYTVSFAGLKPGVYKFYCTPHAALGMKGQITVR